MDDLVNISIGNAGVIALLGYLVVFFGLVLLMAVIMIMGKIMVAKAKKALAAAEKKLQNSYDKQGKLNEALDTARQKNTDLRTRTNKFKTEQ